MSLTPKPARALELFYSYAHKDERWRRKLETHLSNLQRQGFVAGWHDRNISAGTVWENEVDTHLNTADIILLLISSDFVASEYCYSVEMMRAMERHKAGEARVIPIILRPTDWKGTPFEQLQVLPSNTKPVTRWQNRDDALLDVARGIRAAVEELLASSFVSSQEVDRSQIEAIVSELDGLPLALDQAGAYIEETRCSLSEYLSLFRTRRRELLQRRGRSISDHPDSVAATLSLSIQKVEQINAAAANLLRLCAYLDPDAIPEEIIAESAFDLGPLLGPVAADTFLLNGAIELLLQFSLLRRNPAMRMLTIHRLVQAILQESMDKKAQRAWAERTVRAVITFFHISDIWSRLTINAISHMHSLRQN